MGLFDRFPKSRPIKEVTYSSREMADFLVESVPEIRERYVSYRVTDGDNRFSARLSGWRTEVLWSPNSQAFAANQTEGGGGIGQRAYVFYL